jgi:hypothetical protein
MGLFNDWVCPNVECENDKPGEKNGHCPECGAKLETLNRKQVKAQKQVEAKRRVEEEKKGRLIEELGGEEAYKEIIIRNEKQWKVLEKKYGDEKYLITPIMSDLDVNQRIIQDMENIIESNWMQGHIGGTTWGKLKSGFDVLFKQFNLLVRQNELILREQKRTNELNEQILEELKRISED